MADNVTPELGAAEGLFKSLVWDSMVKAGLASMFVAVPVLAVWPLGPIITYIVNIFSAKLFEAARLVVDLEVIALRNEAHRQAYEHASIKLRVLAHDKGIDSEEFKKAREDAKAALSQFVQFAH